MELSPLTVSARAVSGRAREREEGEEEEEEGGK